MKVAEPLLATLLAFERTGFAPLQNAFNARDALHNLNVTLSDGRHGVARGHGVGPCGGGANGFEQTGLQCP